MSGRVAMVHGSGGKATGELIDQIFASEFQDQTLDEMEDSALVARHRASGGLRNGE